MNMVQHKMKLGPDLAQHLSSCEKFWMAAALISDNGYSFIKSKINPEVEQRYLVGIGLPTSPTVLAELYQRESIPNCQSKIYHKTRDFFHPKVYITQRGERLTAFVSSGNCTEGGLYNNLEMTLKTDDETTCRDLLKWFNILFRLAMPITDKFLENYSVIYPKRLQRIEQDQLDVNKVVEPVNVTDAFDGIDFTNQFFKKEHYEAFAGDTPKLRDEISNAARLLVRRRLFDLHNRIYPLIQKKKWDLHEHYVFDDTVSSAIHSDFTADALTGMWLHYGRNQKAIKTLDEKLTPIDFMRLQVIVHRDSVGIWNRVGKDNGSKIDREHFRNQMKNDKSFRVKFFDTISSLPEGYFIRIRDENRNVNEFADEATLSAYVLNDHIGYYFIIGDEIPAGDRSLSNDKIAPTVMSHFEKLYPVYAMMKFQGI